MATTTTNYGLTKPAGTDKYDISVFNGNADKIDAQMRANANAAATAKSTADGKQDPIVAGAGISVASDGKTINHSNSVTEQTTYVGSATTIPRIKYDAQGHITEVSTVTVYPPTTPGTAGQVWTSDGSGTGIWADITSSDSTKIQELPSGDHTIKATGDYTILAIGGKGGDGGDGGKGGDGGRCNYSNKDIGEGYCYGGKGGTGGKGGKGAYGFIKYETRSLTAGDVLNITLGSIGTNGSNGSTGSAGSNTTSAETTAGNGTDGTDGGSGGDTIIKLNGTTIITAKGGTGGTGGKGGKGATSGKYDQSGSIPTGQIHYKLISGKGGAGGNGGSGGNGSFGGSGGAAGSGGDYGSTGTWTAKYAKGGTWSDSAGDSGYYYVYFDTPSGTTGSDGTSGNGGGTCSPNSTSDFASASGMTPSNNWNSSVNMFDVTFKGPSEVVNLTNTTTGRVFILANVSQFPL